VSSLKKSKIYFLSRKWQIYSHKFFPLSAGNWRTWECRL